MMAAWMLYSVLVASFIALAAATIDRLFGIWRLPGRYVWLGAMILASVAPLVAATGAPSRLTPPPLERPPVRAVSLSPHTMTVASLRIPLAVRAMRVLRRADRMAQVLWIATSAIVLGVFLRAFIALRAKTRAYFEANSVSVFPSPTGAKTNSCEVSGFAQVLARYRQSRGYDLVRVTTEQATTLCGRRIFRR